jgi:hypothetical protein
MHGITRRGHVVVAVLVGCLAGVFVVANWASPAATPALLPQGQRADGLKTQPAVVAVDARIVADAASAWRSSHEALAEKQRVEAEYAGRTIGANRNTANRAVGPFDLHEALRARQQVEADYYPGPSAVRSAGQAASGDSGASTFSEQSPRPGTLHDVLVGKQRVEAQYAGQR